MSIQITYPNPSASPETVFTQETFDRQTAYLLTWQQSAGAFGALYLHPCWGTASVLDRQYHGQTAAGSRLMLTGAMRLYTGTKAERWQALAAEIVANILFLQDASGGFIHASGEFEPTYSCEATCPIHQFLPALALLEYYAWPHGDQRLKDSIRPAIDRHWNWFTKWWKRGNQGIALTDRAGWCGVTNQDLVVVAVLAEYGRLFGDFRRYEEFGIPTRDEFLSPRFYNEKHGLFLRGDMLKPDFHERTLYASVILPMLDIIHGVDPDPRIPGVIDNATRHLFDALTTGEDGMIHLAWGADLNEDGHVTWAEGPFGVPGYAPILEYMEAFAQKSCERQFLDGVAGLRRTLAAYVFADGTVPVAIGSPNPLFAIAPASGLPELWLYIAKRLGKDLRDPAPITPPCVLRTTADFAWRENPLAWMIEKDGQRQYSGLKPNPGAVAKGACDVYGLDYDRLSTPDVHEIVGAVAQ